MAIHYPNGKKFVTPPSTSNKGPSSIKKGSYSNRGMTLEEDINVSNAYYLANGIAVIHKKPTPIQIVDVHYPKRSAAVIKEAYFKQASTTDYNGVYKGKYLDFEAKETQNRTSFPLKNFHEHQITHMEQVVKQNGISFIILCFSVDAEIYLMKATDLIQFWNRMKSGGRKSITKEEIIHTCIPISIGFQPRIHYLSAVDRLMDDHG
ncbi:Holliday junction resolvase RecU [Peribacillus alkalitolerans]|uniref:Holliday junction resolvase RecU n=1 Tax=Peribacillus alkalitolerans TaxID=1550385 RepID=UPI0013D344E4|nr:Holliday junction resolvase RecU [Peribacillus alkalitolerans]